MFFFQAEDGIRDVAVTGVQTCALPILSLEVVQSLAALNTGDVRLDAPLDPDGDRSLIERFIAEDLPDTEDQAMDRFLSDEIEQALGTLQRRDAKVLRLYFGLDGGREHTLEEIGGMLGVTRERGRQVRDRALKRLRGGGGGEAPASFPPRPLARPTSPVSPTARPAPAPSFFPPPPATCNVGTATLA